MLDYAALSAVASIVREGSFERAALTLGVTRSAISQRVRALEDRLGTVLIVRGQPCTATEAGARLCAHVDQVSLMEGEVIGRLPGGTNPPGSATRPTVRIAVNADSLGSWFLPAIAGFTTRTNALVDLKIEGEDHTVTLLQSGEVLAAVTTAARAVQGCRTVPLGGLRYAAVASPAFMRKWFRAGVTQRSLALAPVLRFDRKDNLQAQWARSLYGAMPEAPTHWVPTSHGFVEASLNDIGWSVNPLPMVQDHLRAGRLVELSPGGHIDVPLHWQHVRIGAALLTQLTRDVRAAASRALVQPSHQ